MTAFRLISLPAHAVLEMLVGLGLLIVPFAFGFSPGGMLASIALGVLITGLAVGSADSLPVSAHMAFDYVLVGALLTASLSLSVVGDDAAALVFLAAGTAELALALSTRYSRRPFAGLG